jgi:hypothetical protein
MYEYELEALPEFEEEYEGEWEGELEEEFEGKNSCAPGRGSGARCNRQPYGVLAWQQAAPVRGLGNGGAIGGAISPGGAALGRDLGGVIGRHASGWLPQSEFEGEFEWELEGELNPVRRVYPDALMEHLGHAAATVQSEAEAEAFLGALIPLAARLIPRVAPAVMRAAPGLIRGVSGVARTLRRSPVTRPLVRAIPTIARGTVANIAQQVAQGQPVTPQTAVRTLARQTARVLSNPQHCVRALQRSRALDRQYHRTAGAVRPGSTASC